MQDWPFEDPPNTAAVTTRAVVEEHAPVLLVTHDRDDGSWQFLSGGPVTPAEGRVVGLGRMCGLDPTLFEIADLPEGWRAWRPEVGAAWQRMPAQPIE
jgi:hypothetical protein